MRITYNSTVRTYIDDLPDSLRVEVYDALSYFEEFGIAAQLPDVAPIVSLPNTWETRTQLTVDKRRYTIRVLLRVDDDDPNLAYATVAGDKDRYEGDWYTDYGAISEQVYVALKELP